MVKNLKYIASLFQGQKIQTIYFVFELALICLIQLQKAQLRLTVDLHQICQFSSLEYVFISLATCYSTQKM